MRGKFGAKIHSAYAPEKPHASTFSAHGSGAKDFQPEIRAFKTGRTGGASDSGFDFPAKTRLLAAVPHLV